MPQGKIVADKLAFFKPDVTFWKEKIFSSQNRSQPKFYTNEQKSELSSKRLIARVFALLYYNPDVSVNNQTPDIHIPIAHYLTRGYDIQFDLSDLSDKQADTFWNQLIGRDVLAHAEMANRKTLSNKLDKKLKVSAAQDFIYRTFTAKHPYPSISTSFAVENTLRVLGALIVTPIILAVYAIPNAINFAYRLGRALFASKEKTIGGLFIPQEDESSSLSFLANFNQKTKQLRFSLNAERNHQLRPDLKTTADEEYRSNFRSKLGFGIASQNTCVIKVKPESLNILKDNSQGITQEQLGLPPRAAIYKDAQVRQQEVESFIKTKQLLDAHTPIVASIPLSNVQTQPVRIKADLLLVEFNLTKLQTYLTTKGIQCKAQYDANHQISSLSTMVIDEERNPINIRFYPTVNGYPAYIEFSNLPINQALGQLAIERAALMLAVAGSRSSVVHEEPAQLVATFADYSLRKIKKENDRFKTQDLFDQTLNGGRLSEDDCKNYAKYWEQVISNHYVPKDEDEHQNDDVLSVTSDDSDATSVSSSSDQESVLDTENKNSNEIWNVEYPYQNQFSSLVTVERRQEITNNLIVAFKSSGDFAKELDARGYFIYNDSRLSPSESYQKGNPIVERARAFLQAAQLWLDASTEVYLNEKNTPYFAYNKPTLIQLQDDLNKLFWEFETQSIYFPTDNKTQQKALNHFLGKLTYLLYSNTNYRLKGQVAEEEAMAKLYKELSLAEALMVWQQGREEVLVTRVDSKKVKEDDHESDHTYTSLQIDYPISEITEEQYNELATIYLDEAQQPDWFKNEKLPAFAKVFLMKTLALDPTVSLKDMTIASPQEVRARYRSMPATLKLFLGVSNFSESHFLVFDETKNLISRSVEDRSSSLAANEMHDLNMERRVAEENARQVYLGDEKKRAKAISKAYKDFWGIKESDKIPSKYIEHTAPIVLSASVLSPETEAVKVARSIVSEINIDMLNVKDNAIEQLQIKNKETKDEHGNPIIHLMGSNHIINGVRHWPRALTQHLSLSTRKNSVYYLEQMEFLAFFFGQKAAEQSEQQQNLKDLQDTLEDFKTALENHEGLRRKYLIIPTMGKDYKFEDISDHVTKWNLWYSAWAEKLEDALEKFPAKSRNDVDAFALKYKSAFGNADRAKDFLCGLHALFEYIKITNLYKETEPLRPEFLHQKFGIGSEDRNANLYRSALERVFIRKMHGRAHVACKSGKDRTGMAVLMANAIEKFWAIHGYIPQYDNQQHWNILLDYAADEFVAKHHQKISKINSPGADGLKSLKGMIPPLLKSRIMEKVARIQYPHASEDEIKKIAKKLGKEFFTANKLGSSINKPKPEFYNAQEMARIKSDVDTLEVLRPNQDEYLLNQLINPRLADILRRALAEQMNENSNLLDMVKIDQLNEAIFREVDFKECLKEVGLEHLAKDDVTLLKQDNFDIAQAFLDSNDTDEALLTRIWQFSKRQPQVFEGGKYSGLLQVASLKELIERQGIDDVPPTERKVAQPYVIPTTTKLSENSITPIPEDELVDRSVTVGMGMAR